MGQDEGKTWVSPSIKNKCKLLIDKQTGLRRRKWDRVGGGESQMTAVVRYANEARVPVRRK